MNETKSQHTARHAAVTADGQPAQVDEFTSFIRYAGADGSHTEWLVTSTDFRWGRIDLNLRSDGSWETVEATPRRLTRRP